MSVDIAYLPTDSDTAAEALNAHIYREEARLAFRRTMWLLAWYYLNGCRRFDLIDPSTGRISQSYVDKEGNLEYASQELLTAINRTAGRLAALNLLPKVVRSDQSLAGIRDRSVTQIIADAVVGANQVELVKSDFSYLFTCLGSCGVAGKMVDHESVGLTSDIEVVHPREMFPFPSLGQDHTKVRGMVRQRVVPLAFVRELIDTRKLNKIASEMRMWRMRPGESTEYTTDPAAPSANLYAGSGIGGPIDLASEGRTSLHQVVVQIRETWLDGPRGTCSRYLVTSGRKCLIDTDYRDKEVYRALGFSRFYNNGTFHGAGLFDIMYSVSREYERLCKWLFNNVRNTDKYGFLCMPSGMVNQQTALRDVGYGLRVLDYEPDSQLGTGKPFHVTPYNSGELPGKVAQFAKEQMESVNTWRDLVREKGRVDSQTGLAFLDEQVQQAVSAPTSGMAQAFSHMYRALINDARNLCASSNRALPVTRISLDLAGAIIDPKAGTVSFANNPVPDMSRLTFTVQEQSPKLNVARKAEALEMLTRQIVDRDAFVIYCLQEGLDFAAWFDPERSAVESVTRNLLILFGDGVYSAGKFVIAPEMARPELQLKIARAFLADPRVAMASVDVQTRLIRYVQQLQMWGGAVLPPGVPTVDEAAEMQAGAQQPMFPPGYQSQPMLPQSPIMAPGARFQGAA